MSYKITAFSLAIAATAVSLTYCNATADEREIVPIPSTLEGADAIQKSLNGVSKQALMQGKLNASSEILDGLVNGDFRKIKHSADALQAIALTAPRQYTDVEKLASGEHLRREFIRLAERLGKMADERNLEGAAYVNQNITATCISCHLKLRERRAPANAQ